MNNKERLLVLTITSCLCLLQNDTHARNCVKGKPCGNGCIAVNKTCRIDNQTNRARGTESSPGKGGDSRHPYVLRRSRLRLPKVYIVTAKSVEAREAPFSKKVTGRYKLGQSVFVYATEGPWARLSNMQPEEWVKLEHLQLK